MQQNREEISPIKQRILQFVEKKNIRLVDFFTKSGVNYSNFKGKSQKSELGGDKIAKIIAAFPEISPLWLISGKGPMLRYTYSSDTDTKVAETSSGYIASPQEHDRTLHVATPSPMGDQGIPLLPVSAMAGALSGDVSVLEYECERYVVPAFQGADFLIPVKGSSMYPKYSSGDIVACKRVPASDLFFQWNKVYVIDTDQGPLIKRIRRGSSDDTVLIVSDNTAYEPFELRRDQIRGIALVIGVIRLE